MAAAKFPRRDPDGSFRVRVVHRTNTERPGDLAARVEEWFRSWLATAPVWALSADRQLNYFDDFAREPHHVTCSGSALTYVLEGRPAAMWWRDWLAFKIVPELRRALPEVLEVEEVTNLPR